MKQEKENKKEWQSVLVWSLVISGLLLLAVVTRLHLDLSAKQDQIMYFIPLSFFFLWGAIIGVLFNESKVKKVLKKKFVIIRRPISMLFLSLLFSGIAFSTLASIVDPIIEGSFAQKIFGAVIMGFLLSGILVIPLFVFGFLFGFTPMFLIHHTLKLYRKHLKHILEPC